MIVLDTNVVSELMRSAPEPSVIAWVDAQVDLFTTAITVGEVYDGILRLPEGRRRSALLREARLVFDETLAEQLLPYDSLAGQYFGTVVATRRSAGRPISIPDAQIAAICLTHDAALATRNVRDFDGLNLTLHDPWTA